MSNCCAGILAAFFQDAAKPVTDKGPSSSAVQVGGSSNIRDHYTTENKALGAGSYGTVCKCKHKKTGSVRALKTICKTAGGSSSKVLERFYCEIAIMKRMDHPGIIKLYETFEDKRNLYLIMEMCSGGELFDRIVEAGHFTETQAAIVMKQMISAIYYLHTNMICHRDLKPENFLFHTKEPIENNLLKLIDFGLATPFKTGQALKTKSGTPYYVAPQVLAGHYNELCDIWSCGVIMYVLLCGYPPFLADADPQVLALVRRGHFTFPAEDWSQVSDDAKQLIRKLLAMKPQDRFTAEQALSHIWIKEKAPRSSKEPLNTTSVSNLKNFRATNRFKKMALQVIATQLSEDKIETLRKQFIALDENGDGRLSIKEISDGLKATGMKDADLKQILAGVDFDGSGSIEYKEFLAATLDKRHYLQEDALWSAFCVFDKNGDGKICMEELRSVLEDDSVGQLMQGQSVEEIMKEIDEDGSGEIEFEEFVQMMRKS
ncbi:unnamed protein product [Effrenium voratum]|uniref:Calcium-dependent protein kinase 1 n=1 Tax=Effrenium voratum TaxID=2562239 RepID=A0AA36IUE7_9DINO|nr:unnamed protein product [Effrenium voratum]CAJ1438377.1 unnamed protein product [Effrenium voratum]